MGGDSSEKFVPLDTMSRVWGFLEGIHEETWYGLLHDNTSLLMHRGVI